MKSIFGEFHPTLVPSQKGLWDYFSKNNKTPLDMTSTNSLGQYIPLFGVIPTPNKEYSKPYQPLGGNNFPNH